MFSPIRLLATCSLLAALLAAASGLAHTPLGAGWLQPAAAHDLQGVLALAMAVAGVAGALPPAWRLAQPLRTAATVLLLAAAAAVLADAARVPASVPGPHMGPLGSAGLALALVVLAAAAWTWPASPSDTRGAALQGALALLWAICVASLCALLPARLLLDGLPLDAGLSWSTTVALTMLAASATGRVYRQPAMRSYFNAREDRRIFSSYLAMLFGAIGLAAMLIAGLLTVTMIESVKPVLRNGVGRQALALGTLIEQVRGVTDRAAADAAPPGAGPAAQPATREWLRQLREQLDLYGQVGIQVVDGGRDTLTEGSFQAIQGPTLPLSGTAGMAGLDDNGLVLQMDMVHPRRPGTQVHIQLRPFRAEAQLPPTEWLGSSADSMLCADAGSRMAQCLLRQRPQGLTMPLPVLDNGALWPIQRAWRGQDGVDLVRDPALAAALVAYAPVGRTGLGIVQKMMVAPLVRRMTDDLPLVLLTLLAVAAAGAGLLYRRAFPLLRTLRYAKAQIEATLEHLPRGVLTLDAQDRIRSSNPSAHALSGRSAAQLEGLPVHELISDPAGPSPWTPAPGTSDAMLNVPGAEAVPVEVQVERFDFEGEPRSVVIIRDMRREHARQAELIRWERMFFHAGWGVATSSDDGQRLELVNPACARMLGYRVDELKQRPLLDIFAPEARASALRHIAQVHALGHHRFESVQQRRDGSVFPVLIDATLVHGAGGKDYRVVNVQDISDQKQAQEAVQRSEALLQLVLKSLPVGVWIADRDGRVVATNPAVDHLWGGPVSLLDGRPVGHRARRLPTGQIVAAGDFPMLRAIRTGQASLGEVIEIEGTDGSRRTLTSSAVPLVGAQGEIQGAIEVNEDLTTLHRAEAAIVAARHFFEDLFQSAALGMAVWNAHGQFERTNQALCELLATDEESLLACSLADVGEADAVADDVATLARMRAGALTKTVLERRWRRRDGCWIWVLVVVSLVGLPDAGEPQFVVQVLDIDSRRRFQEALQASQARLLNAHRIAGLADWEWDAETDRVWLSEQGRHMMGLPADHPGVLEGTDCLAHVHADDRAAVLAAVKAALQGRQPLAMDYRLVLDDGAERYLHHQGELDPGPPRRLVGVLQDITERKQAENELRQSRQRLRALSAREEGLIEEERRHMAREVHDELGQALTALKMELSLLGRRFGSDPTLAAQAARMGAMVDGTIDVVRHVASNLRPSALDFGLVAAIEWLAEDFGLRWEIPCTVVLEGRDVTVNDSLSTALFRIVQESLTNIARHASARHVDIRIVCADAVLRITVHDDGVGFDVARAQEGRGSFGLLGMRERALKIGARLRVQSQPGGGSTIEVELPLTDLQEP